MVDTSNASRHKRSPTKLLITLALPAALIVYSVAFYRSVADLGPTSRVYPQVVMGVLAVLLLVQIWTDVRGWLSSRGGEGFREIWHRWRRTAYTIAWTLAFIWAMERVGFYEALVVYVVLLLPMLGVRRPMTVVLFTGGTVAGMYLLFDLALNVRLPSGLLVG